MSAGKEKAVGCAMAAGVAMAFGCGALSLVLGMGGVFRGTYTRDPITNEIRDPGTLHLVPVMFGFAGLGVLIAVSALVYSLWSVANEKKGPRRTAEESRVMARYAYSRNGQLLVSEWEVDAADRPRFYVRLEFPYQGSVEFECTREVYNQAGEGMRGKAEYQGKWLGSFIPYIGPGAPPPPSFP